ncbi:MAG: 1-deoxy-D-xylulose 5-phosphate reductoisomerase, 1-deoxy-D-xylulose-5-phosphate reductoisomerase [Candidatus Peregrinibacteria bacterium GW2011_GWF2_33_10]|nr:MAG: 1-deoxy-D-xylulose 5-phosphate reductoisomerase, 1-deoxy-D-xylulose-5-phosphate reductoisomerase [Candidatus Peregrinibacteria bacterium GW2011_GWF2_33_10]OGJ44615.1 MAG: hypothetical protein A2263_00010 [Candidatus Peregrinibacteria bacterium RIFOXYA2_FULL_33_21]OGJ46439.1 MAG: hypothetical protein A2272_06735 [Candidatus Peregrinibacteria bacterium RIFOXYA12_FULL_33_12]
MKKKVAIFGSTGSVGTQTLEVIKSQKDRFELSFLVAGKNKEALEKQMDEFGCEGATTPPAPLIMGVIKNSDIIVVAIPSEEAVYPTIQALKMGKKVLLASKEALICEGEKIMAIKTGQLLPIDSELSAIWQCLQGRKVEDIEKIILTASGGPFFVMKRKDLEKVTLAQALNHPTWKMGKEITINSATLMNKGFEVIEAHFLFGIPYEKIEVLIHPQSLVHGIVVLKDGNTIMHVAKNDMKIFISWALNFPEVNENIFEKLNLINKKLEFFEVDHENFPALKSCIDIAKKGVFERKKMLEKNKENVEKFLAGEIQFIDLI